MSKISITFYCVCILHGLLITDTIAYIIGFGMLGILLHIAKCRERKEYVTISGLVSIFIIAIIVASIGKILILGMLIH